jgi:hypothetical protein
MTINTILFVLLRHTVNRYKDLLRKFGIIAFFENCLFPKSMFSENLKWLGDFCFLRNFLTFMTQHIWLYKTALLFVMKY